MDVHPVVFKLERFVRRMEAKIERGETPTKEEMKLLAELHAVHDELQGPKGYDAARAALEATFGKPRAYSPILGRDVEP